MRFILCLLVLSIGLASCSELTDKAPVLVSYELTLDSIENTISAKDTLIFRANLEDDVSLASYSVSITAVNPTNVQTTSSLSDFSVDEQFPIAGKRLKAFNSYILPISVRPGNYVFRFEFMDEAGFTGENIEESFLIINKAPEIRLNGILADSLSLVTLDNLSVSGEALSDFTSLDSLKIQLFRDTDSSRIYLIEERILANTNPFSFNYSYQIQPRDSGVFSFIIELSDQDSLLSSINSTVSINQ